jgi:hypothetical protein
VEFLPRRDWPNAQVVAGAIPQHVALIHRAWELMEYRYQLIEAGQARVSDFEPLVVFLDEYAEFRTNLLECYAQIKVRGDPSRPATLAEVASLARKARTARIHLVLSTQRPDAEFLGGEMRDNFGERISMGRLSPQGAMMMWENPAVGVTLPRGCVGRATATNDEGRPVEVQCYRFPSLDAPPGSQEQALVEVLRPPTTRHPRLVIIPPDADRDPRTGDLAPLTFRDYAQARWALAADRPDLDPLAAAPAGDPGVGRALSSPLASLGLTSPLPEGRPGGLIRPPRPPAPVPPAGDLPETVSSPPGATADVDGGWPDDDYAGYAAATTCRPAALQVGDLIEVEEGSGVWAVVDEPPDDDPSAPGMVAVSWRGDGDESGALSVPDDLPVPVRRPVEEEW